MNEKRVKKELRDLINSNGIDSKLNCTDFILADYLYESLVSLDKAFRLNLQDYIERGGIQMREKTMNRLAVIENEWNCPYFVDGFHKVNLNVSRLGCLLSKRKCDLKECPLPEVPRDFMDKIKEKLSNG